MSLTNNDLRSIKDIVDLSANRLKSSFIKRIDELYDTLSIEMENGLQEVRDQITEVQNTVDRIEKVQLREIIRVDGYETSIVNIRKALYAT